MESSSITAKQHTQIKWAVDISLSLIDKNRHKFLSYSFRCNHCDQHAAGSLQDAIRFISIDHAGHTTMIGVKK